MDILSGSADEFRQIRVFTHRYARPNDIRALAAYLATFAAYAFGFIAVFWGLGAGLWGVAVLGWGLTAFAIVRLYVIQHDCGHQSYFSRAIWNDWAGQLLSIVSLSPYETMKSNHNRHHRYVGDLDHREDGEVYTMTLAEWEAASPWARRLYRAYRAPWIMLPLGALFTYFIRYRWPKNTATVGRRGVLLHNLALGLWLTALWAVAGELGLWIWFGTSLTAGILGVFQVYLQHNFEETWWGRRPDLDPRVAALQGSSALNLGWLWDLGTGNIAYHDLHHFNPRIPLYNLRRCHFDLGQERPMIRIGWRQALRAFRLKLWDEARQCLVAFPADQNRRETAFSQV